MHIATPAFIALGTLRLQRISFHPSSALAEHTLRQRPGRRPARPTKGKARVSARHPGRASAAPIAVAVAFAAAAAYAVLSSRARGIAAEAAARDALEQRRAAETRQVESRGVPVQRGVVVREIAHDRMAFTQGLSWAEGWLYESTGLRGRSSVRRIHAASGSVVQIVELPEIDFGEGCCVVGKEDKAELVQLLWKVGVGNVYSLPAMKLERTFKFEPDGWGLARDLADDRILYLSDGTDVIRVMRRVLSEEGATIGVEEVRRFTVRNGGVKGASVSLLNELEIVRGELWANIWMSELVARIDIETGFVVGWIDLRGILDQESIPAGHRVDVLNGIAWDAAADRVFVTGKMWPKMYEISVASEVSAWSLRFLNPFFTDPARVRLIMKSTEGV